MSARRLGIAILLMCALALATVVPAGAVASPRSRALAGITVSGQSLGATVAAIGRRIGAVLEARIAAVLERRKTRFDNVSARLTARVVRVSAIADKVAAVGGNVTSTRALLDSASAHLTAASDLEAKAVDAFRAVPSASDRRAAFAAARTIGRQAAAELASARRDLRKAVVELRAVVNSLKAAQPAGGAN
jgi:hypothetical protein